MVRRSNNRVDAHGGTRQQQTNGQYVGSIYWRKEGYSYNYALAQVLSLLLE